MFQQTETVSAALEEKGFKVHGYHAGMSSDVRTSVQDKFMVGKDIIVRVTKRLWLYRPLGFLHVHRSSPPSPSEWVLTRPI